MSSIASIPSWVHAVREFQQLGLINKAVIDATAVDIPLVALAKNKTEAKERLIRQGMVLAIAFIIAPLHAKFISKWCSKAIGLATKELNETVIQLSSKELANTDTLQQGLKRLLGDDWQKVFSNPFQISSLEPLRKAVIKAKTNFFMWDLGLEGLMFASVGFIKVFFGNLMSGKKQFTGELGAVSEQQLDALYQKAPDQQKSWLSKNVKEILTIGLGVLAPISIGLGIRHSLLPMATQGLKGFMARTIAPLFDYNYPSYVKFMRGWPLLSDASLLLTAIVLTVGELASARSKREFKELAIQRNSIDALFFFGAPAFMKLFSGSTVPQLTKRSARTYLASFGLSLASIAGIILYTNALTIRSVKRDAQRQAQGLWFQKLSQKTKRLSQSNQLMPAPL